MPPEVAWRLSPPHTVRAWREAAMRWALFVTLFYTGSRAGPAAPPPDASPLWTLGARGPRVRRSERLAQPEDEQR